jgi:hypothetical protein
MFFKNLINITFKLMPKHVWSAMHICTGDISAKYTNILEREMTIRNTFSSAKNDQYITGG